MRSAVPAPLLLLLLAGSDVTGEVLDKKPNFVLMMVDDLGIGDIGCYGNNTIRTTNIDRLASEGVKLTQHIAAAPLCSPSRSAFMTGRYALRSGMGGMGRVQVLMFLGCSGGLSPSETTFAKRLQHQGYTTGLIGKWHLGLSCEHRGDHCHHPNQHGFSYFYGLPFSLFNDCVSGEGSELLEDLQHSLWNLTLLLGLGLLTIVGIIYLSFVHVLSVLHRFNQNRYIWKTNITSEAYNVRKVDLKTKAKQIFFEAQKRKKLKNNWLLCLYLHSNTTHVESLRPVQEALKKTENRSGSCETHSYTNLELASRESGILKLKFWGDLANKKCLWDKWEPAVPQVCARVVGLLHIRLWLLVLLFSLSVAAAAVWVVPFKLVHIWNCIIMRNQDVIEQPITMDTLPERLLGEAQDFIKRNADQPFLLFFSLAHVHSPLFKTPAFAGKSRHGRYGDNMEEVDWMIGKMTETVDSLGLANNTLIYFTSDHGGHIESGPTGSWNGIYKGGKAMGGWEGGIRVPGIFRWPGRLAAGKVVDEPTSLMDLYPTLKYLAKDTQPDRHLDGFNLMPLLEGKAARSEHEFMFHYCGTHLTAVRWHPPYSDSIFKVHFFTPNFFPRGAGGCYDTKVCLCHGEYVTRHDPPLMFDLHRDPSESRPLSPETEPRYAEVLEQTAGAVKRHKDTLKQEETLDGQLQASSDASGVQNQMTWEKIVWRPWLQPCCGTFPFCGCKENTTSF